MEDAAAVERFRQYLRIKTVQPHPDYAGCREFLRQLATEMQLPFQSHEVCVIINLFCLICKTAPGKYVCILSWPGTDPSLSSVMLNSHSDVVPVVEVLQDPFFIVYLVVTSNSQNGLNHRLLPTVCRMEISWHVEHRT
jgi:aminoacylase